MSGNAARSIDEFMGLSDEELMRLDPATFENMAEEPESREVSDDIPEAHEDADDAASTDDATAEDGAEDAAEADAERLTPRPGAASPADTADDTTARTADASSAPAETERGETTSVDYKTLYERVTAPFRANGKDMQVSSPEDIVALMQMGANYNKKMAALKPNLRVLKLLENNGLLDEAKLSFLIDLDKKNPDAIQKLVKESGIDPLDMDVRKESEYRPNTYTVDDREVELDSVLEEIQDTPHYAQTINIVSTKWDSPSKQVIANNPQLLKVINNHMASGVYTLIAGEVERARVFGRLTGISDIEAYRTVGDEIQARGGFDHLAGTSQPKPGAASASPSSKVPDPRLKDRKRAASSTSAAPATAAEAEQNPLAMSDAEFEKRMNARLL